MMGNLAITKVWGVLSEDTKYKRNSVERSIINDHCVIDSTLTLFFFLYFLAVKNIKMLALNLILSKN